jgi:hypothetical protein
MELSPQASLQLVDRALAEVSKLRVEAMSDHGISSRSALATPDRSLAFGCSNPRRRGLPKVNAPACASGGRCSSIDNLNAVDNRSYSWSSPDRELCFVTLGKGTHSTRLLDRAAMNRDLDLARIKLGTSTQRSFDVIFDGCGRHRWLDDD